MVGEWKASDSQASQVQKHESHSYPCCQMSMRSEELLRFHRRALYLEFHHCTTCCGPAPQKRFAVYRKQQGPFNPHCWVLVRHAGAASSHWRHMFFAHVGTKRNDLQGLFPGIQNKISTVVRKTVLSFPYWVAGLFKRIRRPRPGCSKMDELQRLRLVGGHLFLT